MTMYVCVWCVAVDFRLVDQHVDVALELQARRSNEAVVPSKRAVEAQKTPWGTLQCYYCRLKQLLLSEAPPSLGRQAGKQQKEEPRV